MTDEEYLDAILADQDLRPGGDELTALHHHRDEIEQLLRDRYGMNLRVICGGSIAKGSMIRESYDLDLHCYFANDDTQAGYTLEEIFHHVEDTLAQNYVADPKRTAIRLRTRNDDGTFTDLMVDVVPGRYIDATQSHVFLYQNEGEKSRLQTNIETQIAWVRDSGVVPVIRLVKLWKVRQGLGVKTFVLELLVIEILQAHKHLGRAQQFAKVLEMFATGLADIVIKDPANPTGNPLSVIYTDVDKESLANAAQTTRNKIARDGLQSIFDTPASAATNESVPDVRARVGQLARASVARSQPWAN